MERKWWTLIAVCTATFMLLLDVTVVNVALPNIAKDLGASFTDMQWVIDAYALTLAALLLTGGATADRLGRRKVFQFGMVVFVVSSALCGFAGSPLVLNLSRALQGAGGACMFTTGLALLASTFPPKERGTALGIWGAVTGSAVAVGPLIGGVLVEWLGWRSIFFVNVPIGFVTLYITATKVGEYKGERSGPPDLVGTACFSLSLFALIFGLIRGNAEGWSSGLIIGSFVAAVLLMIGFVVNERLVASPMLDLTLFKKPAFLGGCIAAFVLSAAMFGMILYLVLYLQNVKGYGALASGLRFIPLTAAAAVVAPLTGKNAGRGPRWFLGGGLALIGLGLLLMGGLKAGGSWTALLPGFIIAGVGVGLVNPALATTAIGVVETARAGMASGINATFRQTGVATGIAVWGALFEHKVTSTFREGAIAAHLSGVTSVPFGGAPPRGANPLVLRLAEQSFVAGLNHILLIAGVFALVGAVAVVLLVRPQDFIANQQPQEPASEPAAVGV